MFRKPRSAGNHEQHTNITCILLLYTNWSGSLSNTCEFRTEIACWNLYPREWVWAGTVIRQVQEVLPKAHSSKQHSLRWVRKKVRWITVAPLKRLHAKVTHCSGCFSWPPSAQTKRSLQTDSSETIRNTSNFTNKLQASERKKHKWC